MESTETRDRSPQGRFKYLAEKRVGRALLAIRSVANLSDKKNYEYTEAQVNQIIEAMRDALQGVEDDFAINQRQRNSEFELK
jgi:hypothetical protein